MAAIVITLDHPCGVNGCVRVFRNGAELGFVKPSDTFNGAWRAYELGGMHRELFESQDDAVKALANG